MYQVTLSRTRASRVAQFLSLFVFISTLGVSGTASAILIDRGPNLVYDNVLDITWVRDASLCVTLSNCVNRNDAFVTGGMPWADANTWAANLVYQGFSDWRLPYASVAAGAGPTTTLTMGFPCTGAGGADEVACRDNEMGYMFYYNLDGNPLDNKTGNQTAVGGEMLTGIEDIYWSGTEFNSLRAWFFRFDLGAQGSSVQPNPFSAWAVRSGDVPEPSSLLLIGLGALGLVWSRRRGRRR